MHRFFRFPNYFFLFVLSSLIAVGFFAIYSATYTLHMEHIMLKQTIFALAGLMIFFTVSILPKHFLRDFSPIFYVINVLMLFLLNILQWLNVISQPARWIDLGGITFQPSELMKITLILMLAWIFSQKKLSTFQQFLYSLIVMFIPVFLILLQPDMGTAAVLVAIFLVMCFLSRPGWIYVVATFLLGFLAFIPLNAYVLHEYQIKRLLTFLNPAMDPLGEGWSINQALIAVGSGGVSGKGYLLGTQSKMGFLPNTQYSDFIFAVIGEEWGFFGSITIIILFFFLFVACGMILAKTSSYYSKLIIWAIISFWFVQMLVNIGMNIGLMPVTGVPLPFISYGGTSLIASIIGAGIIYNIHLHQKKISY